MVCGYLGIVGYFLCVVVWSGKSYRFTSCKDQKVGWFVMNTIVSRCSLNQQLNEQGCIILKRFDGSVNNIVVVVREMKKVHTQ